MVPKKEIYARIELSVESRLPELLVFYKAPSVSRLIEEALKMLIEKMDGTKERTKGG